MSLEQILKMFDNGMTASEIALAFGEQVPQVLAGIQSSGRLSNEYLLSTGGLNRLQCSIENVREWAACTFVESDPDRMGGMPVLRGSRMPADWIVEDFDSGETVDTIADDHELNRTDVFEVLRFSQRACDLA